MVMSEPDRLVRTSGAGGEASIEHSGTLLEMRDAIEKIDGGAAAFLERARLYGHKEDIRRWRRCTLAGATGGVGTNNGK